MAEPNADFRLCPDYATRPRDCAGVREQKLADGGYYICTFCRDAKPRLPLPKDRPRAVPTRTDRELDRLLEEVA